MKDQLLCKKDVLLILKLEYENLGSQNAWAKKHGISQSYVNDVLQGRKNPGGLILDALGLETITGYRRKAKESI